MNKNLESLVRSRLNEATRVSFGDVSFILNVDVNEDPKKKGVKVQFIPRGSRPLSQEAQDKIAIALEGKLEQGLSKFGMKLERDRNLKDKTIVGFIIYIEYFREIVKNALRGENNEQEPEDSINPA